MTSAAPSGDGGPDVVCYSPTGEVLFAGNVHVDPDTGPDPSTLDLSRVPGGVLNHSRYGPDGLPNHYRTTGGYFTPDGGFVIQYTNGTDAGSYQVPMSGCTYQVRQGAQTSTYKVGLDGSANLVAVSVVSDGTLTIPYGDGTMTVPKGRVVTTDDSGHVTIDGVQLQVATMVGPGSGSKPVVDVAKLKRHVGELRVQLEDMTGLSDNLRSFADYVGTVANALDAELSRVPGAMGNDQIAIYEYMDMDTSDNPGSTFQARWPTLQEQCITSMRDLASMIGRVAEQLGYDVRLLRATEQTNLDVISKATGVNVSGLLTDPGTAPPAAPRDHAGRGGRIVR